MPIDFAHLHPGVAFGGPANVGRGQGPQAAALSIGQVGGADSSEGNHGVVLERASLHPVGQVIDVLLSDRRDLAAARRFFASALRAGTIPAEVTTDRAPAYPRILDELIPSALHTVEQYANNPVETDHGRLKARLRPRRWKSKAHPLSRRLRYKAGGRSATLG